MISDSEALAVVCEDEEQLDKIAAIREPRAAPAHLIVIDPPQRRRGDAVASSKRSRSTQVRERGHSARPRSSRRAAAAVRPEDPFTFIYTSGTTGPPKGCVLTHGNYRDVVDMIADGRRDRGGEDDLPVPAPRPRLRAARSSCCRSTAAARSPTWAATPSRSWPSCMEVKPTYLPSVPRVFEKIYTLAPDAIEAQPPEEREPRSRAIELGVRVRDLMIRGEPVPEELQALRRGRELLYKNVRALFGGNIRQADQRRRADRPRDPRVLLRLRRARARGLRDDRDGDGGDLLHAREPPLRHGRAAAARVSRCASPTTARSSSKARTSSAATTRTRTRASARSSTGGCTPATSARSTRTATCRSPAARRTSSSPPAARTSRRRTSRTT